MNDTKMTLTAYLITNVLMKLFFTFNINMPIIGQSVHTTLNMCHFLRTWPKDKGKYNQYVYVFNVQILHGKLYRE